MSVVEQLPRGGLLTRVLTRQTYRSPGRYRSGRGTVSINDSSSGVSPTAVVVLVLVLAGLDIVGAVFAKEWTSGRSTWLFLGGAATFVVLFGVYAVGLRLAEMSTVTFGWIVGLQVGILIVERVRYDVNLPPGKWVAIVAILCLQAYLVLAPAGQGPAIEQPRAVVGSAEVDLVDG